MMDGADARAVPDRSTTNGLTSHQGVAVRGEPRERRFADLPGTSPKSSSADALKRNGIPKYIQLKDILMQDIAVGFRPGDKYYTQNELMEKFGLSYATVIHALRDLKTAGVISRTKGRGTFITEKARSGSSSTGVMTEPLYIFGRQADPDHHTSGYWWADEIQKGIINSYNGPVKITSLEEILGKQGINAILLRPEKSVMHAIQGAKNTYVIIDHRRDLRLEHNSISWEMLLGIYELMAYLIRDLGHRRVAYIGEGRSVYHADRYAAYEIGLRTFDIPYDQSLVVRGLVGAEQDGYDAMRSLLSLPERPTAVFVDTDLKAYGAVRAAKDAGLCVPGDIAIAGFDDMPGAGTFDPSLTTVRIPYYDMGAKAVEMLFERMRGKTDVKTAVLKSSLVIRNSCGRLA